MRIIAGQYKGRRLKTLEGLAVRPTSDRMRETLFNILMPRIEDARFLDLCAGSGAVGIEALSRGASHVTFVESSRKAAAVISENLRHCGIRENYTFIARDALTALKHLARDGRQFDIVYFDPPYDSELYSSVLWQIAQHNLLAEDGIVIVEHRRQLPLAPNYDQLRPYRELVQGESVLTFFQLETNNSPTDSMTTEALIDELSQLIWDYHHLNHPLEKSDLILALGSNDTRVAEHAADLYLQGWAPRLMFSGNVGALTRGKFAKSEAETFADIAIAKGVPRSAILIEPNSTNTGENIVFSRRVLAEHGLDPQSFIVVQKPYMERRAYATFMKNWPGKHILISSPPSDWATYPTAELPKDLVINIMVGDLQRIRDYPAKGFQIEQDIPANVWQAYEQLIALGYDKHLID